MAKKRILLFSTLVIAVGGALLLNNPFAEEKSEVKAAAVPKKIVAEDTTPNTIKVAVEEFKNYSDAYIDNYWGDMGMDTHVLAVQGGFLYTGPEGTVELDENNNVTKVYNSETDKDAAKVSDIIAAIKAAKQK
jgi:hypothetical protein